MRYIKRWTCKYCYALVYIKPGDSDKHTCRDPIRAVTLVAAITCSREGIVSTNRWERKEEDWREEPTDMTEYRPFKQAGRYECPSCDGYVVGLSNTRHTHDVDYTDTDIELAKFYAEKEKKDMSRKAVLEAQAERVLKELAELEAYGEDVYDDDTVLAFDFKFSKKNEEDLKWYSYVAFKVKGKWYLTGNRGRQLYDWDDLVAFWRTGLRRNFFVAAAWELVQASEFDETN